MWLVILLLISIVNAEYIRDGKSYSSRRQFLLDSIAHKNDSIPVVKTKSINSNSLPITDSLMIKGLNVKQADIRDLIQGIAMQFNLNIVLDKQVEGDVTVNFNNISVKEALTLLIEENGLEYKLGSGNTIKILMKKNQL